MRPGLIHVPVLLIFFAGCGYSNGQLELGKRWCKSLIQSYKSDPTGFRDSHPSSGESDTLLIRPDRSKHKTSGVFSLTKVGSFECRSWEGGFSGKAFSFTSKSGEWRKI